MSVGLLCWGTRSLPGEWGTRSCTCCVGNSVEFETDRPRKCTAKKVYGQESVWPRKSPPRPPLVATVTVAAAIVVAAVAVTVAVVPPSPSSSSPSSSSSLSSLSSSLFHVLPVACRQGWVAACGGTPPILYFGPPK